MVDVSREQIDKYTKDVAAMETEQQSFRAHWQEIASLISPRRGRFFTSDRNKGDKRYQKIINSKATRAVKVATAGIIAGSMNATQPWVEFGTYDPDLMERQSVKDWLFKAAYRMRAIHNESNLYNMAPTLIKEYLMFGTAAMLHEDDFDDVARFYTFTAGSYYIAQNSRNVVNRFARKYEATVDQIVSGFGLENVSRFVKEAYDKGNYHFWAPVVHLIAPNEMQNPNKAGSQFKRFKSCYWEPGSDIKTRMLRYKGYDEFPVYVPRWELTSEDIYATDCPGMTVLGDIKGLQIQEKRKAQAIDKHVNPPLKGPAALRNVPVSSMPGGLNIYDEGQGEGLRPVYQVNPNLNELRLDMAAIEKRIDEGFYVHLFRAISDVEGIQPRNQFDLQKRDQERLIEIGPALGQMHGELLNPLVDRTFNQMVRAKMLPPPPPELQGQPLRMKYISPLAMAQRSVGLNSIESVASFVSSLVQAKLTDGKKFDADQAIDDYANNSGSPPRIVRDDDTVAAMRQQEQQQAQMAQMAEVAKTGAGAVKDIASAQTSEPSVLTALNGALKNRAQGR